jgi:uncharacterized protein (DUF488 family)
MAESRNFDLLTVGHSNHPLERFLGLLKSAGVTCIADVRSRPFSRRFPWFSQTRLPAHLQTEGIAYLACGDTLGGRPADPSLFHEGVVDYEAVARSAVFRSGLEAVLGRSQKQCLCLMCAEREPLECHRCLLVARVVAERGCTIGHILADGTIEAHAATEDRLLKLTKTTADLFASDRAARLAEAYRRRARAFAFRTA